MHDIFSRYNALKEIQEIYNLELKLIHIDHRGEMIPESITRTVNSIAEKSLRLQDERRSIESIFKTVSEKDEDMKKIIEERLKGKTWKQINKTVYGYSGNAVFQKVRRKFSGVDWKKNRDEDRTDMV